MLHHLRAITSVSAATILSRILGLIRDVLLFAMLGLSSLNSAFIFGFTLPNLFRRLLGEGALTSSSVPLLTDALAQEGKISAFKLLNQILTRLVIALLVLTMAGIAALSSIHHFDGLPERWHTGANFAVVLLPYMILICLAALISASLNTLGKFTWPALSAVWLNLTMIAALIIGLCLTALPEETKVWILCAGVLAGGVLQLGIPALCLIREGWRPGWDLSTGTRLQQMQQLLIPGLVAAAIFQINVLVSRVLAFALNDSAAAILYLANRLIELPLGVFAIAVTTVLFPSLSRLAAENKLQEFARSYRDGVALIMSITVPAGMGLMVLADPILTVLFQWGNFAKADVQATRLPLMLFAAAVPFYAWATLLTRCFHARKDMRTPLKLAGANFVLNLVLSVILMRSFGTAGLAAANLLVSIIHCILLNHWKPLGEHPAMITERRRIFRTYTAIFTATGVMGITIHGVHVLAAVLIRNHFAMHPNLEAALVVTIGVSTGVAIYGIAVLVMVPDIARSLKQLITRKLGR
ncbi:MAG: murein biosynthesis integral membrane protein MurJ [Verrucomicrobia bacterium]|nr:murein biosynthesis integral membrane protein MurJ [Verrucomicrobiota bacterium]